jgi:hypothetical protein
VARIASAALIAAPSTSNARNAEAVASSARCFRANFRTRYDADGGPASTASSFR